MISIRIAGDHFVLFKYGERLSLKENFKAALICKRLQELKPKGIVGVSNSINSVMIDYDPEQVSIEQLTEITEELYSSTSFEEEVLLSRLWYVPVLYGDPWTLSCALEFHGKSDIAFVAEFNNMSTEELVQAHSQSMYWVLYNGFTPGLPSFVSIDPKGRLTAPKYTIPRTHTPVGTVGIGGVLQCIYSLESPGGYQMLGRTPLPIFDIRGESNPVFKRQIAVFSPGDRIIFVPIDLEEYRAIRENLEKYTYRFEEEYWSIHAFEDGGLKK